MNNGNRLKILFVEDMDADFELAESELRKNGIIFASERVEKSDEFIDVLKEFKPDLVISDYSLPQFNGMQALKILKDHDESLPFIILTGTLNEEIAVDCMKSGANDYVIKEHIGKLPFAVNEALRYRDAMIEKTMAERELLESELRYRSMFENNFAVMVLVDPVTGAVVDVNPAASDYYGYDYNDLLNMTLDQISCLENRQIFENLKLAEKGNKNHFFSKHKLKNGSKRDVEVFISPISYKSKTLLHCIIQDVTERTRAIEDLKTSLDEKKDLIREIFHRTKNNMQVIISLFSLLSVYVEDEKIEKIFKDMECRIRAMALVHEKLFQSKNLSKIDLKSYLTDLVNNVMSDYGINENKISVRTVLDNVEVLIDTAIPAGLVINELLSNVMKYAFPGDMKGEMELILSQLESGEIEVVISDNGAGKGMTLEDADKQSMGFQIVKNIIEYQLKGTAGLDTSSGVKWVIKFRDNVYRERI